MRFLYNNGTTEKTDVILLGQKTRLVLANLRTNPLYTKYYTFITRLVVTGVIPILALLFFNINIYLVGFLYINDVCLETSKLLKNMRASRRRSRCKDSRNQNKYTPNR